MKPASLEAFSSLQALNTFPVRIAPQQPQACKNYLFLIGHGLSDLDRRIVIATAQQLTQHGYVYVADVEQEHLEDRDNIRYLPLREGRLPHFGQLSLVAVLRNPGLALQAVRTYPEAQVYAIEHDVVESKCA